MGTPRRAGRVYDWERERAIRQQLDVDYAVRLGRAIGVRIGRRGLAAAARAFAADSALRMRSAVADTFGALHDPLVQAMVYAKLRGMDRATKDLGKTETAIAAASSPAYTRGIKFLRDRLALPEEEIALVEAKASAHVVRVLATATQAAQETLQRKVAEIYAKNLHVRAGVKALRKTWGKLGVKELGKAWGKLGLSERNSFQLEAIFRTQTQLGYAAGNASIYADPEIDQILWGFKYVTAGDDRVRDSHVALDGVTLPKDDPFWATNTPPNGWACFLPGTRIRGTLLWVSKARYSGQAVEIKTAEGLTLAVTVNHPIATEDGWIPAGQLQQGDNLLADSYEIKLVRSARGPHTARGTVRDYQQPSCIEDIFDAFSSHGTRSVEVSPLDLHGDAANTARQIYVACANRELMQHLDSTLLPDYVGNRSLAGPDLGLSLISGIRRPDRFLGGLSSSRGGLPGAATLSHHGGPIILDSGPFQSLGLRSAADGDTISTQERVEARTADPEIIGDLLRCDPCKIAIDRVTHIRHFEFSGHVYDLQTENGYIMAGGVVCGNCRCQVIALFQERKAIAPPETVEIDGKIIQAGADKGFAFHPGRLL